MNKFKGTSIKGFPHEFKIGIQIIERSCLFCSIIFYKERKMKNEKLFTTYVKK